LYGLTFSHKDLMIALSWNVFMIRSIRMVLKFHSHNVRLQLRIN